MRHSQLTVGFCFAFSAVLAAACSGSTADDSGSLGAQDLTARDHGAASKVFPAFPADVGQLQIHSQNLIASPKVVTLTWDGDANFASYETFGDEIGASTYWRTAVREYGVGAGSGAGHVHLGAAPATLTDSQVEDLVAQHAETDTSWPAFDEQNIYVMYLPTSIQFTSNGANACDTLAGYHDSHKFADGKRGVFAVIAQNCRAASDPPLADYATSTAAHEIAEASTDPYPGTSDEALTDWDDAHGWAWDLLRIKQGEDGENGDACDFYKDSVYTERADLPFAVQRLWSNASAAAGRDPCVPAPDRAYINVVPQGLDAVSVLVNRKKVATRGLLVQPGKTRSIALGFASDRPTGAWNITVVEGTGRRRRATRRSISRWMSPPESTVRRRSSR